MAAKFEKGLNLNVGLMGHVDAGKTSLAKVLSHVASTAAFDKDPQAQSRGITLDLGFSACTLPIPEHLKKETNSNAIFFTLVDCPGHSSLLRTIIGGAHIIDMILLVVDVRKLIQPQTAECIIIGEIIGSKMIVALNKIDTIEKEKRDDMVSKAIKKIRKTLDTTTFTDIPIVPIATNPKDGDPTGIDNLIDTLLKTSFVPIRHTNGPFQFAVDHCFPIKGNGYVMTGTMLRGSLSVNDMVYIEPINDTRKVKSIEIFHKPVTKISHGDRAAICVTNIESRRQINRALVCFPGLAHHIKTGIICLNKIKYFKYSVEANSKYDIMIGNTSALIKVLAIFSGVRKEFDLNEEYKYIHSLDYNQISDENLYYFLLFELTKSIAIVEDSYIIGFKPDLPPNVCRIAFWGKIADYSLDTAEYNITYLPKLKIYRTKHKEGIIERFPDEHTAIVKNMFKKETDLSQFIGLSVKASDGRIGRIESGFGKSGKVKISFSSKSDGSHDQGENIKIVVKLEMKRYIFDNKKQICQ